MLYWDGMLQISFKHCQWQLQRRASEGIHKGRRQHLVPEHAEEFQNVTVKLPCGSSYSVHKFSISAGAAKGRTLPPRSWRQLWERGKGWYLLWRLVSFVVIVFWLVVLFFLNKCWKAWLRVKSLWWFKDIVLEAPRKSIYPIDPVLWCAYLFFKIIQRSKLQ